MGQEIAFIDYFNEGNKIFDSKYFSSLLKLYKKPGVFSDNTKGEIRKILLAIFQLQIGALSENLTRKINDGIFKVKDDEIDLLDDIGDIIQLNYQSSGLNGLEYVMESKDISLNTDEDLILCFSRNVIESIYASVLDYKSLIDSNWHYLYCPFEEWAKFCKINIFLLTVRNYIINQLGDTSSIPADGYYHDVLKAINTSQIEPTTIATTNYNNYIYQVLQKDICYLNGSTDMWYDPYVNRIGTMDDLNAREKHFLVPLIFTQSGTKPMTSIEMSRKYVDMYDNFYQSTKICVIGFGFNSDDEHINGILRTLVDIDNKHIVIVDLNTGQNPEDFKESIASKLKVMNVDNLEILLVDKQRQEKGINWITKIV